MIEITMGLINTDDVTWFDLFFRNLWITTVRRSFHLLSRGRAC